MAYFNYSFSKFMITRCKTGSGIAQNAAWYGGNTAPGTTMSVTSGILQTGSIPSVQLNALGQGVIGFFNPNNMESLAPASVGTWGSKPFVIANSTFMKHDKVGKFHGGYQETNKSKKINPKFINKVWYVDPSELKNTELMIGEKLLNTPVNTTEWLYEGYSDGQRREFKTGQTYYLKVDIKGDPASRFARHDLYRVLDANGGCETYCEDGTVAPANTWDIYRQWIDGLDKCEIFDGFILPVLVMEITTTEDETTTASLYYFMNRKYFGQYGITEGTDDTANSVYDIEKFESVMEDIFDANEADYSETAAGCGNVPKIKFNMALIGAYVDTKFGTCSFSRFDHYGVEPIQIYASEVQFNGETCDAERVSVRRNRPGIIGTGYGEEMIRDLILNESYRQNYYSEDYRTREISGGNDVFDALNKDGKYGSFYILHSVPRHNNDTGIFDNDQYTVRIIYEMQGTSSATRDALVSLFNSIITANGLDLTVENYTRMHGLNSAVPAEDVVDQNLNNATYGFPTEVIANLTEVESEYREDPQELPEPEEMENCGD